MPLPVSAQTYMPNPLTSIQASQQGLQYGQSVVQGFLNAAQSTFNIANSAQDFEMAPEKLDLERRRVENSENAQTDAERRTDLLQESQDRQDLQQESKDQNQSDMLDIHRDANAIRREEIASAERRARIAASGRSNASAQKSQFEGVASSYLLDGDTDSLSGEIGDISTPEGRYRRSQFVAQAAKDPQFSQALVSKAEDDLATGRVADPTQRQMLQEMSREVSLFARVQNTAEKAQQSRQFLEGTLGFAPLTRGRKYAAEKSDDGGYQIWELDPETKKRQVVGYFQEDDPTKANANRSKLFNSLSTLNRLHDIEQETTQAIQADAKQRIATSTGKQPQSTDTPVPPEEDRPAKIAPQGTSSTRLGLDRAPLSPETEKNAVTDTQLAIRRKEKIAAKRRALKAMGRDTSALDNADDSGTVPETKGVLNSSPTNPTARMQAQ